MFWKLVGLSLGVLAACSLTATQISPAVAGMRAAPRTLAGEDVASIQKASPGLVEAHGVGGIAPAAGLGLSLHLLGGKDMRIGLPASATTAAGQRVSDGTVVYTDQLRGADTALQALSDGSARGYVVINRSTAPTEYRFTFQIPAGTRFVYTPMGSSTGISLVDSGGSILAAIAPAWAKGADGRSVPSAYRVEGNTIVQTVEHRGAAYPVVADPWITLGWSSVTLHLTYADVVFVYVTGYAAAYSLGSFLCSRLPWPFSGACGVGVGTIASQIWQGALWWARNYYYCGLAITWYLSGGYTFGLEC